MQKLTVLLLSLALGFLFCCEVKAESICQSDDDNYHVNLQTVIIPSNAEPGDILKVATNTVNITCGAGSRNQQISRVSNPSWNRSGMTVNVDGITCPVLDAGMGISELGLGIAWTNFNSSAGTWGCMSVYFPGMNGANTRRGLRHNGTAVITDKFYLVKTKKDVDYGKTGKIDQTIYISEADSDNNLQGDLYKIYFQGEVQLSKGGCAVETHKDVQMGNVSSATFHGVGSTGPVVPFTVALSGCQGIAANVMMRLEPTYGYADKNEGVIALSGEEGGASGVGIQLMMDGKKIDANAEAMSHPFQQGTTLIPFSARYYQVADSIKPGSANSTLVFYTYYE